VGFLKINLSEKFSYKIKAEIDFQARQRMPTNLPPDYFTLERRFREAETVEEKIELLQEMYSVVPKHKGTDHLRADLRRKLAKLNDEAQSQKSVARHDSTFKIPRAGAGQVVIIGPSGTGKTTLFAAFTEKTHLSDIPPPPSFEPSPAMMPFENIQIQLVDTPPLSLDYVEPRLKDLIRGANLALLVVDLQQDPVEQLKGSIQLLDDFHILPRQRCDRYPENPMLTFLPFLVAVNKCDTEQDEELYTIFCELMDEKWPCTPISAQTGHNLERLKNEIVANLDILRVYTKVPGKEADHDTPFVMKTGSTLEDLAGRIHKDFLENMKYARVWGKAVHVGQMVQRNYVLQDGDIVEIHIY
jgi:uncharacterized protein